MSETDLPALPAAPRGRYRHYKGGEYELLGVVRHSETLEPLVLYRPLHGNSSGNSGNSSGNSSNSSDDWVRPYAMFFSDVEVHGQRVPRFARTD